MIKMKVRSSFCGVPVFRRQSIGSGLITRVSPTYKQAIGLLPTKTRSAKSVAALMEPMMIKKSLTLMQWLGCFPGSSPARVVQKAEIGVHCQMKTRIMESVKATTKMPQYMRIRRNWTIGKIRYWNKMLVIRYIRRCKIDRGRRMRLTWNI